MFACVLRFCQPSPLCRPAKPPVPRLHLWSPGEWLIWKYNHSGQDFISSLSRSLPTLSIALISFTADKFSVSRFHTGCLAVPNRSLAHIKHVRLLSSPLLLLFNAAFPAFFDATLFLPTMWWSIRRCWTLLSLNLTYWEEDEVWVITNQPRVRRREGEREKHSVLNGAWKVSVDYMIHYPKKGYGFVCIRPWLTAYNITSGLSIYIYILCMFCYVIVLMKQLAFWPFLFMWSYTLMIFYEYILTVLISDVCLVACRVEDA